MIVTFVPLTAGDLPLLHNWLQRQHVEEWWESPPPSLADLEAEFRPSFEGSETHRAYLAFSDGHAIGFTQSYIPVAFHHEGWWLDEHDPNVRGIDQFLADGEMLGRGVGTAMVTAFVARLFADPVVTRIQTDPDPTNHRAIRCYEKSGFRRVREVDTPDGRALLMYCERSIDRSQTDGNGQSAIDD